MKKYAFLLFFCLFFISCASNKLEPATPLRIEVEFSGNDMASIYVYYNSDKWAFIKSVELRNAAGELKQYKFKNVQRNVYNGGKISEYAVITMFNHSDEFITVSDVDKLRAFVGGADITGRALAERRVFYFVPVEIIYK